MTAGPSYTHIFHLILELRQAALDNGQAALAREDGGFGLCLGAALANDAAEALEAMLAERGARLVRPPEPAVRSRSGGDPNVEHAMRRRRTSRRRS